jgi:hypothetical protein
MNPYIEVARRFMACRKSGTSHGMSAREHTKWETNEAIAKARTAPPSPGGKRNASSFRGERDGP